MTCTDDIFGKRRATATRRPHCSTNSRAGKALGSGKRLELLDLLAQNERTVEALAREALGMTTASSHLQILKQANLVTTRRDGTKIYYRLAGEHVAALSALVRTVASDHLPDVPAARAAYLGPETEPVTREELLHRVHTRQVTVIDVRPREEYAAGHIPGALCIPLDELPQQLANLPADQEIVAYCALAHDAVRLLTAQGRPARTGP